MEDPNPTFTVRLSRAWGGGGDVVVVAVAAGRRSGKEDDDESSPVRTFLSVVKKEPVPYD
eukprot:scaffold34627_cov159-Amphora_coffeaeformis.AAC.6